MRRRNSAGHFDGLPHGVENHFRLLFYFAVFRVFEYLSRLAHASNEPFEATLERYPFLAGYFDELRDCMPERIEWADSIDWWRNELLQWESKSVEALPVVDLNRQLHLGSDDLIGLMAVGLVEEDIRFGSLFASLQEPLQSRRPCLGLVGAIVDSDPWALARRLVDAGLAVVENANSPRAEWILRVRAILWDAIRGHAPEVISAACRIYKQDVFPDLDDLVLSELLRQRLARLPSVIQAGQVDAVILRGMANSGRRTLMGSLARTLGRDLIYYDRSRSAESTDETWQTMGPLSTVARCFPVVELDPAPGETVELPALPGYRGPLGIIMRREGGVTGPSVERAITLALAPTEPEDRLEIWKRQLRQQAGDDIIEIASRFLLPLGNVQRAAGVATAHAALENRDSVSAADVQMACRSLNRQALDTLAQRLEAAGDWDDLVLNEVTSLDLRDLETRCKNREKLRQYLGTGFRSSFNRGVRALFNGPSGTGKTFASKILTAALQMDLYRVDLASVVNKYIGETEKNLSQLFSKAEELDVVLLIDEGDALMGNRTDVKSANDRYANLETNYLLQRLETYEGIVIVTTNAGKRIDTAFQRRFDVVIEFPPPGSQERLLIWERHLPPGNLISPAWLDELAHQARMTGGQIRNAALFATMLSVQDGRGERLTDTDVEAAVRREYRKQGASCPLVRASNGRGHQAAVMQFLSEMA
jgi:SpoVK/Ycf46/Vps4 family AAA+-type ATPase